MRKVLSIAAMALLVTGCSSTQIYHNPQGTSGGVAVLYTTPTRPYNSLGVISAKKYKPGWSDPTVGDAIPQLVQAAASMGADAVILRQSEDAAMQDRFIRVEGEAIKYADGLNGAPTARRPETSAANELDPSERCDSCKDIGDDF